MSSSWNTEEILKEQAEKLHDMAYKLEEAVEILRSTREDGDVVAEYKENVKRAKSWMN